MVPIRTILCPTDFSAHSDNALRLACALARDYSARVLVVHAVPAPVVPYVNGILPSQPSTSLGECWEALGRYEVPEDDTDIERRLLQGEPAEAIVAFARQTRCDLIVIGTHGRSGVGRLLMGSVAEAVLRDAPCPVLTVKTPPDYLPAESVAAAAEAP
jgi:nucleotide-binding universal stress UspA family protein